MYRIRVSTYRYFINIQLKLRRNTFGYLSIIFTIFMCFSKFSSKILHHPAQISLEAAHHFRRIVVWTVLLQKNLLYFYVFWHPEANLLS